MTNCTDSQNSILEVELAKAERDKKEKIRDIKTEAFCEMFP